MQASARRSMFVGLLVFSYAATRLSRLQSEVLSQTVSRCRNRSKNPILILVQDTQWKRDDDDAHHIKCGEEERRIHTYIHSSIAHDLFDATTSARSPPRTVSERCALVVCGCWPTFQPLFLPLHCRRRRRRCNRGATEGRKGGREGGVRGPLTQAAFPPSLPRSCCSSLVVCSTPPPLDKGLLELEDGRWACTRGRGRQGRRGVIRIYSLM